MPWSDYLRLARYWASHPPLRDMVQAFLGIKPSAKPEVPALDPASASMAALKRAFPAGRL